MIEKDYFIKEIIYEERKMRRANIIEVIAYSEKSGYRRDYNKEDRAWNRIERRNGEHDVWSYRNRDILRDEYKDELLIQASWDDEIRRDSWTGYNGIVI